MHPIRTNPSRECPCGTHPRRGSMQSPVQALRHAGILLLHAACTHAGDAAHACYAVPNCIIYIYPYCIRYKLYWCMVHMVYTYILLRTHASVGYSTGVWCTWCAAAWPQSRGLTLRHASTLASSPLMRQCTHRYVYRVHIHASSSLMHQCTHRYVYTRIGTYTGCSLVQIICKTTRRFLIFSAKCNAHPCRRSGTLASSSLMRPLISVYSCSCGVCSGVCNECGVCNGTQKLRHVYLCVCVWSCSCGVCAHKTNPTK